MNQLFDTVELEIVDFSVDDIATASLCPNDENQLVCETNDCGVD